MSAGGFNTRRLKRDRRMPPWLVAQCQRKVRHATRDAAEEARLKKPMPDVHNSYECMRCRGWHIGHLAHEGEAPLSYCRFGWDGSDVYVYDSVGDFLTCCGCKLERGGFDVGYEGDPDYAACLSMILHLRVHREAGHVVPLYALAELAEEGGLWTRERILWALASRWWRLVGATACRALGHAPVPALSKELPHVKCRRCRRGWGWRHEDGTVHWL